MEIHRQLGAMREQELRDENEVNSQRGDRTHVAPEMEKERAANVLSRFPQGLAALPAFHDVRLAHNLMLQTLLPEV